MSDLRVKSAVGVEEVDAAQVGSQRAQAAERDVLLDAEAAGASDGEYGGHYSTAGTLGGVPEGERKEGGIRLPGLSGPPSSVISTAAIAAKIDKWVNG